jgi:exodeoxyribonuclease I
MREITTADPKSLESYAARFRDERLRLLLPLYKARNFPHELDPEERIAWDDYCRQQLYGGGESSKLAKYFARLQELSNGKLSEKQRFILEELQLYGQSLLPADIS